MSSLIIEMAGRRFGRLLVLAPAAVGMREGRAGRHGSAKAIAATPSPRQARTCGRAQRFLAVAGATNGNATMRANGHRVGSAISSISLTVTTRFSRCNIGRRICNIGRRIGHFEEDNDFSARLALERAISFFHGLFSGRAQRCHSAWERLKLLTVSNALKDVTCRPASKIPALVGTERAGIVARNRSG
jgi:hypothetical protein